MNNHNTHFYSKEEVERTLKSTEEFEDGEQLFYFIGTLRYLYDNNKEKDKEIERLSKEVDMWNRKYNEQIDITNELEKWLEENIKISKAHDNQLGVNVCNTFLNKLKELKEGK